MFAEIDSAKSKKMTALTTEARTKMCINLTKKLGPGTLANLTPEQVADMEEGIYSVSTNVQNYTNQAKLVYLHLSPSSHVDNNYLLPAVKEGLFTLKDVGSMNECDMNPVKWQGAMCKIAEAKQVSHGPQVVPSDIIKCRCGGQTTFTESQTRSCDEAMTIKATCLKCGKRFNV
jgi:DNA-directed RNA polymerase subunit M/transcription elongation factor TFIIS